MEIRDTKISFGKNGNGFTTNKITLPVPWVKALGFTEKNRDAIIKFENNKIIIMNKEMYDMKLIKVYFGTNDGENVVLFENVIDKKVIIFDGGSNGKFDNIVDLYYKNKYGENDNSVVIDNLKIYFKENTLNKFYDMVYNDDNLYDNNVLDDFEVTLITEYEE